MADIRHLVKIKTSPQKVYAAITTEKGLAAWRTPETSVEPLESSVAFFHFAPKYHKEMKIEKLVSPQYVEWFCQAAADEWIGTRLTFELRKTNEGTDLYFAHNGWKDHTPLFSQCSFDWAMFLRSVRLYCETGKGNPYPNFY